MKAEYKITFESEKDETVTITMKSRKTALDVKDQLQAKGIRVKAEMSKEIE